MTGSNAATTSRRKANAADEKAGGKHLFDRELDQFPPDLRWREWMLRVEAVIFASAAPTRGGMSALSEFESMVLMAVGYFQPIIRAELSKIFGKEVSRDATGSLRNAALIAAGPRSPTPGAPYTDVTTRHFLSAFGMETLRDLPDIEALEDAGLLSRAAVQEEVMATVVEGKEE